MTTPTLILLAAVAVPDARAILERSDLARNGWSSFTVRVSIETFENGRSEEKQLFQVYQKGTEKSWVEFLNARDKGRSVLMLGDDMWVYLPDTTRPIRITPLERLSGNASNGDVARTHYSADYDPAFLRTEVVNGVRCHVLELTARRKGATYRRIHYWLEADSSRPLKADFYLVSGKHYKSATFDAYQPVAGGTALKRFTIYDHVRKGSMTVIEYTSFASRNLPDRMFHQSRER